MRRLATFLVSVLVVLGIAGIALRAQADETVRILAFGDSLTAGYGLSEADGFTAQLAAALQKMGRQVQVINGGVSGDTSAGGLSRIDWSLADQPQVMLLELGGNDMLRALPPTITAANLDQIVAKAQAAKVTILLVGMKAAPNLGADYRAQFDAIYPDLAKNRNLLFYPFMLDGVAADPNLLQGDGIHPNPKGVAIIVDRMLPSVIQAIHAAKKPTG